MIHHVTGISSTTDCGLNVGSGVGYQSLPTTAVDCPECLSFIPRYNARDMGFKDREIAALKARIGVLEAEREGKDGFDSERYRPEAR